MSKLQFIQTLERYGEITGIGEVLYDDELGTCFEFEEGLELTLLWNEKIQTIFASIFCGQVIEDHKAHVYPQLLQANFFWNETSGATLALEQDSQAIYLVDKWKISKINDADKLNRCITHMVNAGKHWRDSLKQEEQDLSKASYSTSSHIQNQRYRQIPGLEAL